jgi:hypothetical protein
MNHFTKQATKLVVIATMLCTFPACPPEEEPGRDIQVEPELQSMEQYWPMAEGNFWLFLPQFGDYTYTYEVMQDHSTDDILAYDVLYRIYDGVGFINTETKLYYIFLKDYFIRTHDNVLLEQLIADPEMPLPNDGYDIVAPRLFYDDPYPKAYLVSSLGSSSYTSAGPLIDMLQHMNCPGFNAPIPPETFPGLDQQDAVATVEDGYCGAKPALRGQAVFAKDIGPLRYRGLTLSYANIGGNEYAI